MEFDTCDLNKQSQNPKTAFMMPHLRTDYGAAHIYTIQTMLDMTANQSFFNKHCAKRLANQNRLYLHIQIYTQA